MPERYANVPDAAITADSLVGENIRLNYQYGVQQTSENLVVSADGTASGALSGNWSYDVTQKILTIGSLELCVEREANPRNPTLVYAGLDDSGISVWEKKK